MSKYFKLKDNNIERLVDNFIDFYHNPLNEIPKNKGVMKNEILILPKSEENDSRLLITKPIDPNNVRETNEIIKENFTDASLLIVLNEGKESISSNEVYKKINLNHHDTYQVMSLDLSQWDIKDHESLEERNLTIEEVENNVQLEKFVNIIKNNFDLSTIELNKYEGIRDINKISKTSYMILIKNGDEEVGSGEIYIDNDIAIVDDIAVDSKNRGKGIAKIIMNELINYAKECNVKEVFLFATEDGFPVYKKMGFKCKDFFLELFEK